METISEQHNETTMEQQVIDVLYEFLDDLLPEYKVDEKMTTIRSWWHQHLPRIRQVINMPSYIPPDIIEECIVYTFKSLVIVPEHVDIRGFVLDSMRDMHFPCMVDNLPRQTNRTTGTTGYVAALINERTKYHQDTLPHICPNEYDAVTRAYVSDVQRFVKKAFDILENQLYHERTIHAIRSRSIDHRYGRDIVRMIEESVGKISKPTNDSSEPENKLYAQVTKLNTYMSIILHRVDEELGQMNSQERDVYKHQHHNKE